ncbi:MAG: hypothetical protein ABSG86_16985 [Thermoguttaceae bacterium]
MTASAKITYADVLTRQLIENWGDNKGFNAVEQIMLNMEDRFSVSCVHIAEVRDEGRDGKGGTEKGTSLILGT